MGKPEGIASEDELDVKRYGVIVTCGHRRGLLLPDLEGVDTLKTVAMNMGWLIKVLAESKVELPSLPARRKTNFIR